MSRLLHLINRLKAQASLEMLTPSQRTVFTELEEFWQFPDRFNLYGPQGSGKTFLAWVIARQQNVDFFASPSAFERGKPPYPRKVIIDNAPSEEKMLRQLLAELQLREVRNVMVITQGQIRLGLPTIPLPFPTEADIATVYENYSKLQYHPRSRVSNENFWKVIHSVL